MYTLATVLLDPPTTLMFGAGLAVVSSRLIARAPDTELPRTALLAAGWSLFYGVCVAWFYFEHPDWMFAYLKDAQTVPLAPSYILFLLLLVAYGAFGAFATGTLLARGQRTLAWGLVLGAFFSYAALFWLQSKQYAVLGTYQEYQQGRAIPLTGDPGMQRAMAASGATFGIAAIALLIYQLRRALKPPANPT